MTQGKPHILFVDDEKNILQGLRRGMRSQRSQWEMSFANSGEEALNLVTDQTIDVVVTDMRMPQMDGAELLAKVRKASPDSARIVLSGYSQDEAILKVVGPAHQYLAKPCDYDVLQAAIERVVHLRGAIDEKSIRSLITQTQSLPSIPEKLQALIDEIDNPRSTSKTIANILKEDLGLKAQVLKVCNSAFFAMPQTITDLETAVSLIGLNTLRSMALLEGVFTVYNNGSVPSSVLQRLCSNSLQISAIAQAIAQKAQFEKIVCDHVSAAATLSHIGTLLIASVWPDEFIHAVGKVERHGGTIDTYERELLGTDHSAIGAYFLGLWGFPLSVSEAVAFHHNPAQAMEGEKPVLACLHLAQQLTKVFAKEHIDLNLLENGLDRDFLKKQKLDVSLEEWAEIIANNMEMEGKNGA